MNEGNRKGKEEIPEVEEGIRGNERMDEIETRMNRRTNAEREK